MSGGATAVIAAAAVAGAAIAYNSGRQQEKAAEKASRQAEMNAKKQEKAAAEATNRANPRHASAGAALDAAAQSGKAGASGTMLTGPLGIDPAALNLGKTTLLGG